MNNGAQSMIEPNHAADCDCADCIDWAEHAGREVLATCPCLDCQLYRIETAKAAGAAAALAERRAHRAEHCKGEAFTIAPTPPEIEIAEGRGGQLMLVI